MRDTETSHFWLGHFESMQRLAAYFAEVYDEDEDDEETPISQFARDQGETWYDHDFLEYDFAEASAPVEALTLRAAATLSPSSITRARISRTGINPAPRIVNPPREVAGDRELRSRVSAAAFVL